MGDPSTLNVEMVMDGEADETDGLVKPGIVQTTGLLGFATTDGTCRIISRFSTDIAAAADPF